MKFIIKDYIDAKFMSKYDYNKNILNKDIQHLENKRIFGFYFNIFGSNFWLQEQIFNKIFMLKNVNKYIKKPIIIEAIQYNGDNIDEIEYFTNLKFNKDEKDGSIQIPTLEGNMKASINDFIIKGAFNEFYPCKPDIFIKTYDKI